MGFEGLPGAVDETDLAGQTADALGLTHQRLGIGPQQLESSFNGFLEAIDQPSIDGFNSHLVTQAARDQGMVVAFQALEPMNCSAATATCSPDAWNTSYEPAD